MKHPSSSPVQSDDGQFSHPLEIIPFFARFPHSHLRNYLYTFIFSLLIGGGILLLNMAFTLTWPSVQSLVRVTLLSLLIGYSQHLGFQFLAPLLERLGWCRRWLTVLLVSTLGILLAFSLFSWLLGRDWFGWTRFGRNDLLVTFLIAVALALASWSALESRSRTYRAELAAVQAQRGTAVAELKALRAQVEPHFLYNTLANVVSLIDREPATAKHMTERLIGYLRQTLDASKREDATLGDELAIVTDYLEILRLRMGERLQYRIDAADALRALPLPPMLLQPLVENAIQHGLEPKIEGGSVRIEAALEHERLRIRVADDGLGFGASAQTAGGGSGLDNLRGRLRAMYGDAASLKVEAPPVGTVIELVVPLRAGVKHDE